ncbi:MAG: cell division protein FtsZ [Alphaproteobacteria bacterium]|nr:cell division protein FtsZ [Alphaproteobacteria bacterium]
MSINLTVPDLAEMKPRITVFGVGGAGGNAVNNMIASHLEGVEFVVANTDAQALRQSAAERTIHMGTSLTEGLGAGSQPQVGAAAAEEVLPELIDHVSGSHMVFITAGMGGGTGTGAASVIARAAKEQGVLTVGVVTKPFQFEGQRRMLTAERGIEQLASHVDTLIVIPNQNLFRIANEKTTFADAFSMADQVLYSGVASITELMTKEGLINLDFADVRAIMSEMGKAMMGTGEASGEKRAIEAAEAAISNPLLDDVSMRGAQGLLISITGGPDLTLYEVDEAATRIREEVDPDANIILGATFDKDLEGVIRVSVVATGIEEVSQVAAPPTYDEYHYDIAPKASEQKPAPVVEERTQVPPPPQPIAAEAEAEPIAAEAEIPAPVAETAEPQIADAVAEVTTSQPVATETKMPEVEDFPPIAQRQISALKKPDNTGEPPVSRKRKGLFERLAGVGLGRREDEAEQSEAAPKIAPRRMAPASAPQPMPRVAAAGGGAALAIAEPLAEPMETQAEVAPAVAPEYEDDQLEIPAFLRRQAN